MDPLHAEYSAVIIIGLLLMCCASAVHAAHFLGAV